MSDNAMTVRDVLLGAIDVLAERGWHQGDLEGPDGSVCAVGAIKVASGGTATGANSDAAAEAWSSLCRQVKDGIGRWNDDPARSVEDVVLALKQAAEAAS